MQVSPPEPENKNLRMCSHHNNEDKDFEACNGTQNVTDDREEKEEDGNKGEDWDEVTWLDLNYCKRVCIEILV